MSQKDLLNLDNLDSVVRKLMKRDQPITLTDFNLEPYEISSSYKIINIELKEEDHEDITNQLKPLSKELKKNGFETALPNAVFEAVLNAYVHGNKKDPSKKITVAYKISDRKSNIIVQDEGGEFNPDFFPYILRFRDKMHEGTNISFYDFSKTEKPEKRLGVGTIVMHSYSKNIQYFMSHEGGLIVKIVNYKK